MSTEPTRRRRAAELMTGYVRHKTKDASKPITRADLFMGVPLLCFLLFGIVLGLRDTLTNGVYSGGRVEASAAEEPIAFAFHVGITILLGILIVFVIIGIIVVSWKRRRKRGPFED